MTRRHVKNGALATGILSALVLVFMASFVRAQLAGELHTRALNLGSGLLEHIRLSADLKPQSRLPHRHLISLNGSEFEVQTLSVQSSQEHPFGGVFEAFRSRCQDAHDHSKVTPSLAQLRKPLGEIGLNPELPLIKRLIFESGNEQEHSAYCLRPAHEMSLAGLEQMSRAFIESGDLSRLGTWQGLYARREGNEKDGYQVALLSIEARGQLNPHTLFPSDKDAPGADFENLPRPPGRRVLSLSHDGTPHLNTYALGTSALESIHAYEKSARRSGLRVEHPAEGGTPGRALFIRSPHQSYLVTSIERETGSTLLLASLPH